MAEFVNGATGVFETSWVASGRRSGERIGKADEPVVGFRYDQAFAFINGITEDEKVTPDFYDGLICQRVLDAVLISIKEKRWVKIES